MALLLSGGSGQQRLVPVDGSVPVPMLLGITGDPLPEARLALETLKCSFDGCLDGIGSSRGQERDRRRQGAVELIGDQCRRAACHRLLDGDGESLPGAWD